MEPQPNKKTFIFMAGALAGVAGLCGGAILVGLAGFRVWAGFTSYPSSDTLARQYLEAIIQADADRAAGLASAFCADQIRTQAQADIERYGGAAVRNIGIQTESGHGSDDHLQLLTITFEYQPKGSTDWQSGQLEIMTTFESTYQYTEPRHITCGG